MLFVSRPTMNVSSYRAPNVRNRPKFFSTQRRLGTRCLIAAASGYPTSCATSANCLSSTLKRGSFNLLYPSSYYIADLQHSRSLPKLLQDVHFQLAVIKEKLKQL